MRARSLVAIFMLITLVPRAALGGSRVIDTRHYRIHTDVPDDLAGDLARRMEAMYEQYSRRFASFIGDDADEPFEVYIFQKRADYVRFTEDRFPNTGGVFIPRRKLLAAFLEGQGRDGLRRTLQHEAFHQFACRAIGPQLPIWLNEGLAQIFEEGIWTGSQFIIGQVPPRRVRQLGQDMRERRLTEFRKFLSMSDLAWSEGLRDRTGAATQYNQAWAMAHFLIFAPDEDGDPRYRARLVQMLGLIHKQVDAQKAFSTAFSDNIDGFQQRFVEYARDLRPSPEATFLENQTVLADMLVSLKARGVTFDDIKLFRKTVEKSCLRLEYERGLLRWSSASDPKVYFLDSLGRSMDGDQLYFQSRHGAPLPDMVCRPLDKMQFHTIFYDVGDRVEYEVLTEGR